MSQKTADAVVIGGGVIGLAIARCLGRRGFRVALLERDQPGREASWAAAGMLVPHCEFDEPDPYFAVCRSSLALYPSFIEALQNETGQTIGYRTEGTVCPALDDRAQRALEARYGRQREAGLAVERMSAKEVRRVEPNLTSRTQMALYYPEDHQVENRDLVQALAAAAERAGVQLHAGTPALRVLHDHTRVTGVETPGGVWHTQTVVNAAGSWSRYLSGLPGGCCPPVRPVRGQMAALSVTGDPPCRRIIYAGKSYLVPRSDGRLLIGATVEEAGFRKEVTAGGVLRLLKSAMDLAPVLRDYPVESTWAGLRPATPDGLPILGPTALEGYHLATGHFRNGILLTPLTGEWLTEAIATGQMPPSMQPFLLERFLKTEPDG